MLRYLTAGESHGQALVVIVEGLPAGLSITVEDIQIELSRRRLGYGRGPRQRFEKDEVTWSAEYVTVGLLVRQSRSKSRTANGSALISGTKKWIRHPELPKIP